MSPLELIQLPIKWPLCSVQTHWFTVGLGSIRIGDGSVWGVRLMDSSEAPSVTGHTPCETVHQGTLGRRLLNVSNLADTGR
jgi:hypothetical protein